LTLLAIGFVVGGVMLFGGDDTAPSPTIPDLGSPPSITGDIAPDFTIELLDGTTFRLRDHLADDGRPVLLNLWASWCAPCREEMPALDAAAAAHPDVYFLGVAVEDDPAAAQAFAAEIAVSYPLAIDETDRVGRLYPSLGLPATFLISSEGVIVRTVYGALDEAEVDALIAEAFG
jgi:thiol-disulfide isomerase/thioredoxin